MSDTDDNFFDGIELDLPPEHKPAPTQRQQIPVVGAFDTLPAIERGGDRGEDPPVALAGIAAESSANAAVQGIGSMAGGQLRAVGFSTAEGYITAIRNGVPKHTHAKYLTILRTRHGLTSAAIDSLKLPGPFVPAPAPIDTNPTVHVPTGPGAFDAPRDQRPFAIRAAAEEQARTADQKREHDLQIRTGKQVIAGAVAEGHGVILGWTGRGSISRGVIVEALRKAGFDFAPKAASARAQAGRALELASRQGLVVRVQRGGETNTATWTVGVADHQGEVGDPFGTRVLRVKLSATDQLTVEGAHTIGAAILADFDNRIAAEQYQPADLTKWLGDRLIGRFDAVRIGFGFYIPAKHRERAAALCKAMADAGFGRDWILPAIPLATSDELREGIARGLQVEVSDLLDRLAAERADVKAERGRAIDAAVGPDQQTKAMKLRGDIGEKRAGTFLVELREIAKRVVAYGEILGSGYTAGLRGRVQLAITDLETVLGDDYTGISARFSAVWDEISLERRGEGGIL